ncbi:MAG: DsbA family protein [Patescibacteria group bacterium]
MTDDLEVHRKRNWVATIGTLVVLVLLSLFVAQILHYTNEIKSGKIDPSTFNFRQEFSSNVKLAAIPLSAAQVDVMSASAPSLGRADAPLTIVEFADFGCPYSRQSSFVMRELSLKYPDKIRFIYRDFPVLDLHPIAQKAAEAGKCANDQGQFWQYHDKLYQNQLDLSVDQLYQYAASLNLNKDVFRSCLDSGKHREAVLKDYQDGLTAGVRGTPTFFINGSKVEGAVPKAIFEQLIQANTSNE